MKEYLGLSATKILVHRFKTYLRVVRYFSRYMIPFRHEIMKTQRIRDLHAGERVFVFGNGPSMSRLDPVKVKRLQDTGFSVIAVNNFMYSDIGATVRPNYHVFSDPLDFIDVPDDHPRKQRADAGRADKEKVIENGIPLFAPIEFLPWNEYANTYYFCDVEDIFSQNVADITRPRGYLSWTGMKALAIACFLGFSEIFICGMDYDMFRKLRVGNDNESYWIVEHFFDDSERPSYVIDKAGYSSGEVLYFAHLGLILHHKFAKHPIVNLDPEGLVDAFPKKHNLDVYF